MSRWGRVEFDDLKHLQDQINMLQRADIAKFCEDVANNLAQRLLRLVVKKTPTGSYQVITYTKKDGSSYSVNEGKHGGELKAKWAVSAEIKKAGNDYSIEVYNPLNYASYVEYGHRQEVGRFVPQIGKRLTSSWVEGKHMLQISENEIQRIAPKLIEKELQKMLNEVLFGGK